MAGLGGRAGGADTPPCAAGDAAGGVGAPPVRGRVRRGGAGDAAVSDTSPPGVLSRRRGGMVCGVCVGCGGHTHAQSRGAEGRPRRRLRAGE